jgi:hypothetical protein
MRSFSFIVVALLLVACGGQADPAPDPSEATPGDAGADARVGCVTPDGVWRDRGDWLSLARECPDHEYFSIAACACVR